MCSTNCDVYAKSNNMNKVLLKENQIIEIKDYYDNNENYNTTSNIINNDINESVLLQDTTTECVEDETTEQNTNSESTDSKSVSSNITENNVIETHEPNTNNIEVYNIVIKSNKTPAEKEEFVNTMYAIGKLHETESGIPAALFTAQACYESYYGSSNYAVYKNNLFGFIGYTFNSPEESIAAYERTLNNNRYNHLMGKSLEEWVYGIGPAGYCPTPTYGDALWNFIIKWGLNTRD